MLKAKKKKMPWEDSSEDKAMDKVQRKAGIKEGSAKDLKIDKAAKKKLGYK
jgi:hypothetical protein